MSTYNKQDILKKKKGKNDREGYLFHCVYMSISHNDFQRVCSVQGTSKIYVLLSCMEEIQCKCKMQARCL
jgi:hypothetical protein